MSKKIFGITVSTPLSMHKIEDEIKPVKTVNGIAPDENGNVEIEIPQGANGKTPYIGDNGNWWIGDVDTGVKAEGKKGDTYTLTDTDKEEIAQLVLNTLPKAGDWVL